MEKTEDRILFDVQRLLVYLQNRCVRAAFQVDREEIEKAHKEQDERHKVQKINTQLWPGAPILVVLWTLTLPDSSWHYCS